LDVKPEGWLTPMDEDPASNDITFKGDLIDWGFMRGSAVLDRKTGILDWDATDEYAYLDYIGQADANDKAENYRGKMKCKMLTAGRTP